MNLDYDNIMKNWITEFYYIFVEEEDFLKCKRYYIIPNNKTLVFHKNSKRGMPNYFEKIDDEYFLRKNCNDNVKNYFRVLTKFTLLNFEKVSLRKQGYSINTNLNNKSILELLDIYENEDFYDNEKEMVDYVLSNNKFNNYKFPKEFEYYYILAYPHKGFLNYLKSKNINNKEIAQLLYAITLYALDKKIKYMSAVKKWGF